MGPWSRPSCRSWVSPARGKRKARLPDPPRPGYRGPMETSTGSSEARAERDSTSTYPGVIPMIAYEDGAAALDWLAAAFRFRERTRMTGKDGRISHAEMETGDGLIMLASPTPDYESPRRHRESCEAARRWSAVPWVIDGVLVYVDDVAAHYQRARRAGARILSEPEADDYGHRYRAEDLEGPRWMFLQRRWPTPPGQPIRRPGCRRERRPPNRARAPPAGRCST